MTGHHSGGPDWCITCRRYGCTAYSDGPGYYPDGVRAALRQARAQHTDHPPAQQDGIEESK